MDIFAHALWSWILFPSLGNIYLIILFGILPDLLPFTPFLIQSLTANGFKKTFRPWKKESLQNIKIPKYVHFLYDMTHSFVTVAVVSLILCFIDKAAMLLVIPWIFHIAVDIPTHTKKFFPTHFLYPLSNYSFNGFMWSERWFLISNYILITIALIIKLFF